MIQTNITPEQLAGYFDHTQLKAYAARSDFERVCMEACHYGFAMVAINPAPVALCKGAAEGLPCSCGCGNRLPSW